MATGLTAKLTRIWKDTTITVKTKLTLVQTHIFPIATYAAETWTLKMADRCRIDALEMCCYARMPRILWTARRTNESMLRQFGIKTRLTTFVCQRYLKYLGDVVRKSEAMEKLVTARK